LVQKLLGKGKGRKPRNIVAIGHLDPALEMQVKLFAIAKGIRIHQAYSHLLKRGLASESGKVKLPESMESVEMFILPVGARERKRRKQ